MSGKLYRSEVYSNDSTLVGDDFENLNLLEHWCRFFETPSQDAFELFKGQTTQHFDKVETSIASILDSFRVVKTPTHYRQLFWVCEALIELLSFDTQAASIVQQILKFSVGCSLMPQYLTEYILMRCLKAMKSLEFGQHESVTLLSVVTQLLFTDVSQQRIQISLANFYIFLLTSSPSVISLVLPQVVSSWIASPSCTQQFARILVEIFYQVNRSSLLLVTEAAHKIIAGMWEESSEEVLLLLRGVMKGMDVSPLGAQQFIMAFLHNLFQLSWIIKSEKYTVFVFRVIGTIFKEVYTPLNGIHLKKEARQGPSKLLQGVLDQMEELVMQIFECESLDSSYRPALLSTVSLVSTHRPSLISQSWFKMPQADLSECLDLLAIAERYAERTTNLKPWEFVNLRIAADRTKTSGKFICRYYELLKSRANLPLTAVLGTKFLFLSILSSEPWHKPALLAACADIMNSGYGVEMVSRVLQETSNPLERRNLHASLLMVLGSAQFYGFTRMRRLVGELLGGKEWVYAAGIVNLRPRFFPMAWLSRCLHMGFSKQLSLSDRTACLSMVKNTVLSFESESLEHLSLSVMFQYVLIQLKSCELAHIDLGFTIMRAICRKMLSAERMTFAVKTLIRRAIKVLDGANMNDISTEELQRLLLISGGALHWHVDDIDTLDGILLKWYHSAKDERTKLITLSLYIRVQLKVHKNVLPIVQEVLRSGSLRLAVTVASEGFALLTPAKNARIERDFSSKPVASSSVALKTIELIRMNVGKLLKYVYENESLIALEAIANAVSEGIVVPNDCAPVCLALCFASSARFARRSQDIMANLIACWPKQCSLKIPEGLRLIKKPDTAPSLPFRLLWTQLMQEMPALDAKCLLLDIGSLFDYHTSSLGLLKFLARCLTSLSLRQSEIDRLFYRTKYSAERFGLEDPRRQVCLDFTSRLINLRKNV